LPLFAAAAPKTRNENNSPSFTLEDFYMNSQKPFPPFLVSHSLDRITAYMVNKKILLSRNRVALEHHVLIRSYLMHFSKALILNLSRTK
jgi:hypothetical protein